MPKTYADTFLFKSYSQYEKKMFEFIMDAERIDTSSREFEDVLFDFKRRAVSDKLVKILTSNNVVLGIHNGKPLPKAFKAFVAKDLRGDKRGKTRKVFIDVTDCVVKKGSRYDCDHLDWLTSYLINAMTSYIYAMQEQRLVGNGTIIKDGCKAFVRCFSYVIDRIYKISSVQALRRRVEYMAAIYYQVNLLGMDIEMQQKNIKALAAKITDITQNDARYVDIMISKHDFDNIDTFIRALGRMFTLKDINTSIIASKWMECFGTGTIFAMEFLPAFSAMMTNTYVGGYIDQQMTIEKIAGTSMVTFTKTILQIGGSV